MYYYVYNLQGDVTHIIDATGAIKGTYQYDAWGKIVNLSSLTAIAQVNPFRYRGYYYDTESGLYYLNSRYYNAEWGRFINADSAISGVGGSIQGYNLFAYCMNNPVNLSDESGNWPKWLSGAINTVSGTLQMVAGATLGATVGWTGIGAVAAGFLMVNGAATAAQGIGQIVNHVTNTNTFREDNIVRTGVQSVGAAVGGNKGAAVAGGLYDAAVMTANMYAGIKISTPSSCFIAGTVVLTAIGNKAIEEIEIGDFVWAENPETGEKELKEVVQTFVNETNELVYVYVNGEEIVTTPEHPFYIPNQGWTASIQLRAGDILVLQNGKYVVIEKIQHEILESPITVYNFEVEDFHTYYVGTAGVLVHNTCKAHTSDQQAVIQLAKEYKNGISKSDADILVSWAKEYGLNAHGPMIHPNRSGVWSFTEHIKIFKEHIQIK